jgi:outer membrane protein assembly factor BamA
LNLKTTYLLLLLAFFTLSVSSQKEFKLVVVNTDSAVVFKKLDFKKEFSTVDFLYKEINKIYLNLINVGYISANVDSINNDGFIYTTFISAGTLHKWVNLNCDKNAIPIISKLGYSERFFTNQAFKYSELSKFMEKIVLYYENNGYPFATVYLNNIEHKNSTIKADLTIEKNKFIKLDSLIIEGTGTVSQTFLLRYLNIKNGMAYNNEVFKTTTKKIKQLPFVTEKKAPVLRLTDKQNKLYLFLEKKNASQFDGIVGILPTDGGKTIFTGDIKIKLVNTVLKSGETFDLNWRRLQTQTQDLKATIIYPYIGGLPVGADFNIKLYKKDSTFLDVNNSIGLNYYFSGLNHFKAFYKQRNATLISTSGLSNITVLPDYADVITRAYGIGLVIEKLDYKFNPRNGISINIQTSVGNRKINKNPKINGTVYSNLKLNTSQYQTEGTVMGFINLTKNHVLKLSTQFGSVFGNTIYKNELFRIGGLKTLRGFDEESIYTSTYVIPTIEYRFLFEKNSNLFLFTEGAWYENTSVTGYMNDMPISVGAGINFETKAGIFNLSYAIGNQFNNGFDIRVGKIHAGLTALF